ncbi:hypothetical protein EYB26_001251 [Talaromyces marneffei]|uniref:uncharacterized protein n=1 Tax=Talaromyces marneffei TaxID=37727 RepID=UPI0012A7BCF5|nr:uncharacterized protein EYB26_001251 [Talaromyces marneffei]QGA13601.1 hypothetical protein EYB26_001251 [Talaromyces marneffei]
MINSKTIVSGLALSALAASAPTLSSNFSINLVPINVSRVHPAAKYARAFSKYGVDIPNYLALAARSGNPGNPGQAGSVVVNIYKYDVAYFSPIIVGDSELLVELDTGSADLWVKTRDTPTAGPRTYDPSTGHLLPDHSWHLEYGDGSSVGGIAYIDKVQIGQVTCPAQVVEVAMYLNSPGEILRNALDGIVGLAFPWLNMLRPTPTYTFYENVKGSLEIPVFAAYLKHQAPGAYDFGFIDPSKYEGNITYTPVYSSHGYWNITVDGFSIGSAPSLVYPFYAIVDTGCSLLLLDQYIVEMYYASIRSAYFSYDMGGWAFDCRENIPPFSLNIGSHIGLLPGEYIKYKAIGTLCYGGIQIAPRPDLNILGAMFLKSQYVIFDNGISGHPRVGFAKQAGLGVPMV